MWFLSVTFSFYKQFLWISLLLNLILLGLNYDAEVIISIKLLFTTLLWGWYKVEKKNALVFFHNFRINTTILFITCLIYDLLIFFSMLMAYITLL